MTARVEATKKQKGQILNTVVEVTCWNRDHARQKLLRRLQQAPDRSSDHRGPRPRRSAYEILL